METNIIISKLYKFKKTWKIKKARRSVDLMNKVINSEVFHKEVLNYDFSDRRHRHSSNDEFREITDNEEIYQIIKKGNEQSSDDGEDYIWKLKIKLGRGLSQVGRREGDLIITQNWLFKKPDSERDIAAHWFHEYAHVLGFHHDYKKTDERPNSIPYGLGSILDKILKDDLI